MATVKEINDTYLEKFKEVLNSNVNYARHTALENKITAFETERDSLIAERDAEISANGDPEKVINLDEQIADKTKSIAAAVKMKNSINWKYALTQEEYESFIAEYSSAMDEVILPKKKSLREHLTKALALIEELQQYQYNEREFEKATAALQREGFEYYFISHNAVRAKRNITSAVQDIA